SPVGQRLASVDIDGIVRIWDPATGKEVFSFRSHADTNMALAYRPDGRFLALGRTGAVSILDPATGREVATLRGHAGLVTSVAFSPDGQRLAAAAGYAGAGEVRIHDLSALDQNPGQGATFPKN